MTNPLVYASATDVLAQFASGELSPVEYLTALIDRAEKVEPTINAFCETLYDEALAAATTAQAVYADPEAIPRPLEGLPIATKEKHAIAGRTLTEGSLALKGNIALENAPVIDRLLAAGGIIHARTATPEFSIALYTQSDMWGVTRNPWNPDFTPGGSSGGAGASLAAGSTPLATASDIGGSTRGPASFTGTVGFKAPYGRIPGAGPMTMDYYRGDGVMARTVSDAILFANQLIGPDPRDHATVPAITLPREYDDVAGMRIALCYRLGDYVVDPQVIANTRAVAHALESAGAIVEEIELPWRSEEIVLASAGHFGTMMAQMVYSTVDGRVDELTDYARAFVEMLRPIARTDEVNYFRSAQIETGMQRALAEAMTGYDALICPTSASTGLPAGDTLADGVDIDGTHVPLSLLALMTLPFNICNRCPVLAVPSGHADNNVPTGVQIVGHTYDDPTVFRIGTAIEKLRPWAFSLDHSPRF